MSVLGMESVQRWVSVVIQIRKHRETSKYTEESSTFPSVNTKTD